jgi:hypothetical protein
MRTGRRVCVKGINWNEGMYEGDENRKEGVCEENKLEGGCV